MGKIITFGKCPECQSQLFFSKKEILGGERFAEKICPYCGVSLRHSPVKIILSLLFMLIPTVIINSTYPIRVRLIALFLSAIFILLVWFLFGYKETKIKK